MLQPVCRRTWAPSGRTPVLRQWDRHDRLSVIGALTIAPRRRRYGLYWFSYPHNIRNEQVLRFLQALRRHLPRGFTLIWDHNRPHKAQRVQAWLARQRRIVVEWLPGYAPELNAVEYVWGHTKYGDLASHTPEGLAELSDAVAGSLSATSTGQSLLQGFVRATGLAHRHVPLLTQESIRMEVVDPGEEAGHGGAVMGPEAVPEHNEGALQLAAQVPEEADDLHGGDVGVGVEGEVQADAATAGARVRAAMAETF